MLVDSIEQKENRIHLIKLNSEFHGNKAPTEE